MRHAHFLSFACVGAIACHGVPAHAQAAAAAVNPDAPTGRSPNAPATDQIGDIIVTAQRRAENLQKVPIAITAFSAAALQARGLREITDLTAATPGLQIGNQNGLVQPFLRGIGNPASSVGNESSVAVYIDGVYYTTLASGFFSLPNVDRVEILKGPQGTLFGRNSSGGVIQLVTKDPSHDTSVRGSLQHGNYATTEGNLYATTGLGEKAAIDLSISGRRQAHGYGRSTTTGHRHSYSDNFSARSKLLFQPTDGTRITLTGLYGYSKASIQGNFFPGTTQGPLTPPAYIVPKSGFYDTNDGQDSYTRFSQEGMTLKIEQDLSFAQLASTTASHSRAYVLGGRRGLEPAFRSVRDRARHDQSVDPGGAAIFQARQCAEMAGPVSSITIRGSPTTRSIFWERRRGRGSTCSARNWRSRTRSMVRRPIRCCRSST